MQGEMRERKKEWGRLRPFSILNSLCINIY